MHLRYKPLLVLLSVALVLALTGDAYTQTPQQGEKPTPSIGPKVMVAPAQMGETPIPPKVVLPQIQGAPPLINQWKGLDFNDNMTNTGGWAFIPPDPIGAAGPNHVVNVCNVSIQWYTKLGVKQFDQSLATFFGSIGPPLGTFTFDPKVIYDQYAERFVVVALERRRVVAGDPTDDSFILLAVSKTPDPNAGWWFGAIQSKLFISGSWTWADYPGLAVDDKAVYITNNMFDYGSPTSYVSMRLWIVDKNPFYNAGGMPFFGVYAPFGAAGIGGFETTTQPAHMYGPVPGGLGTYLVSYSGLTVGGFGVNEFVNVIEVVDPLGGSGGPYFTSQFVPCADIEDVGGGLGWPNLPDAPQFGTTWQIEVNDRRALNAVWRDGNLWASTTIVPNSGPDLGQTTAYWWRINTMPGIGSMNVADEGSVGAEDLGPTTYTFFPSVMVDKCGNMAIGFAASNPAMYPGAYYTGRYAADAPGTVQPTGTLQAGLDWYYRAFGGTRNRWGDYSGCALDPADEATFWVYNEYSLSRGNVFTQFPLEDGRWSTWWGSFDLNCQVVSVAITGFDAHARNGAVELSAHFSADYDRFRVNIYRQDETLPQPVRYKSIEMDGQSEMRYVDRFVEPGKTYRYFIGAVDKDGEFFSPTREVTVPEVAAALRQNEPNPFNPTTTIAFTLPSSQHVSLVVYDASGKTVKTLVSGVTQFGPHRIVWDGTNDVGQDVTSGVYFYRLSMGSFVESKKMVLIK